MNSKERLELARWVVERTKKAGASDVSANIYNDRSVSVEYRDGALEKLEESTQNSLSLNIYADNKYSGHSTCDLRKETLGKFIEEAVAATKYLSKDEYRSLPDPKYYPKNTDIDLQIYDEYCHSVEPALRKKTVARIEKAARAVSDKIISASASYSDSVTESVRVHSNGFEGSRRSTSFYIGSEATVADGEKGRPEDYSYAVTRYFKDLPDPDMIGREAASRALKKIGQQKIESGKYIMVVENRTASRLIYTMFDPMTSRALQQKSSYLDGMLEKKIASEKLTIMDDPHIPKALGSRIFNDEGIALNKRYIIENGVLKNYLVDDYYGRKLKMEPNGGYPANMIVAKGSRDQSAIISDLPKAILVTGFIGGNSNGTTGDFSFGIVGHLIENGRIVKPVNEMNITGNGRDFWNTLIEVGNDPFAYSSAQVPTLVFDGVSFSGS